MSGLFDIFKLHNEIIQEYESYISGYINIHDEGIREKVEKQIHSGRFWPEPLIQFNPAYEAASTIREICSQGFIHEKCEPAFKGYTLYRHQVDAIKLGTAGRSFIVTSGTGSGKSLTYIASIFDHIFQNKLYGTGVKAILVYPMNALINSQEGELTRYASNYREQTGQDFPITFACYTGQQNFEQREALKNKPPDILLTNYMMLELILTRHGDTAVRESIFKHLRFLVFDELHTYRGRQGADIAMLIRRIKANLSDEPVCIGTSATMSTVGGVTEQKKVVADFASTIFGQSYGVDQIINETLSPSLQKESTTITPEAVREIIQTGSKFSGSLEDLQSNPFAIWLESNIALNRDGAHLVRGKPLSLGQIVQKLAEYSGCTHEECREKVQELLLWIAEVNKNIQEHNDRHPTDMKKTILPYKLHQFISQIGNVFASIGEAKKRFVTLEPSNHRIIDGKKQYLYPLVFSRITGKEFYCVNLDEETGILFPRSFEDIPPDEEEVSTADGTAGYLLTDPKAWNPEEEMEELPETWFKHTKDGDIRFSNGVPEIQKKHEDKLPKKIWFDEYGRFSFSESLPYQGWFLSVPVSIDPTSGTIFDFRLKEPTKFARLGSEGRSSSTTTLSLAILLAQHKAGLDAKRQKLLSFTDNRQDAALQAGHFNDFIFTVRLRSAIYRALEQYGTLDFSEIDDRVLQVLGLTEEEYAQNPGGVATNQQRNQQALRLLLMYRLLQDLQRGWKVAVPNLEACGLLKIDYIDLKEMCELNDNWKSIPELLELSAPERIEFVYQILDYFRKAYALESTTFLTESSIEKNKRIIRDRLKQPWTLDEDEKLEEPTSMAITRKRLRQKIFPNSIGYQSSLGIYIRERIEIGSGKGKKERYEDFVTRLMDVLSQTGHIHTIDATRISGEHTQVYRLKLDMITWNLGDGLKVPVDPVRNRTYKNHQLNPNEYFKELYKKGFDIGKPILGGEHTGQLDYDTRIKHEEKFREGELTTLFCSPTMELGIDISELDVVHMRNVPPGPANYVQRSGRAGRSGQAALIFTGCSNYSPHDSHYFSHATDMVAGVVSAPKIELSNEELIESHLNALVLGTVQIPGLTDSIGNLFDKHDTDVQMQTQVKLALDLNAATKQSIVSVFEKVIRDQYPNLANTSWFSTDWIPRNVEYVGDRFEKALARWKRMYINAQEEINTAFEQIQKGNTKAGSREYKKYELQMKRAVTERSLLLNESTGGTSRVSLSEFYPFRYLASEGFLPGYNFTRLPIRAFIPIGDGGEYLSRPRSVALQEFAPKNIIYHLGSKYQVDRMILTEPEKSIQNAKYCKDSGYLLVGEDEKASVSPFNGVPLDSSKTLGVIGDFIEMQEARTRPRERISCDEDIRLSYGYRIDTFFRVTGGMDRIKTADVLYNNETLLHLSYIPACRLYQFNRGWKISKDNGFDYELTSGRWRRPGESEDENSKEQVRKVQLMTHETADALYIEPTSVLGLDEDGLITLLYAVQLAVETQFQIEEREIGAELLGELNSRNIMLYEASEGSLGVLSQFAENPDIFPNVAETAYTLLRYDDPEYKEEASYEDLLSYFNQRHHNRLNRFLIKDALNLLSNSTIEIVKNTGAGTTEAYESQYVYLLERIDPNSALERKFVKYLYDHNLRLPDEAQPAVPDVYCRPDFLYDINPKTYVFCDGSVHNWDGVAEKDYEQREALRNAGYDYLVLTAADAPGDLVATRPDIFTRIR